MPNKIDITQTNVQLSSSISVWSGSNLTGPAQSVPIYDASGTASIAQSVSDEYYLVRRNGIIQWAPILASVGSGLSFAFSEFSEESFNESYGSVVFRGSPIRMTNSSDNDPTFYQTARKSLRSVSTDETDVDTTFYQTTRRYIIIYDFNVSFESIIKLNVDKTINVLDGSFV